ncbi:hypothetical protein ACIBI4_22415 [Streptomyces sp. NPDC050418]|uniref:hypothetical protein n=1 Tax=Streptomyces sp. NPDC050418 TaxID=3365612 RepID=UPI003790EEAE
MDRTRPTLRCLREDLQLPIPPITAPLDDIDHALLTKAHEQFDHEGDGRHERIRAIDDEVLFKVKVQRWRGAVWQSGPPCPWLVAAGLREDGSGDDFYAALATEATDARSRYNASHSRPLTSQTYTGALLPDRDDHLRYRAEEGTRFVRRLETALPNAVRASLKDGTEHTLAYDTFTVGIQVRPAHDHETYVAVRITGSVPGNLVKILLDIVPGCDREAWFPETTLPDRDLLPAEQAWSNLMDPTALQP